MKTAVKSRLLFALSLFAVVALVPAAVFGAPKKKKSGGSEISCAEIWNGAAEKFYGKTVKTFVLGIGAAGQTVGAEQVRAALPQSAPSAPEPPRPRSVSPRSDTTMERAELRAIQEALDACGYNQTLAARRLGVGRTTLYRKMKKYGIPSRRGLDLPGKV